jgi:sugar phosphate isomerase/epimerase
VKIGICTTDFTAQPIEILFEKIYRYGFDQVQFDFETIGEEEMPERIDVSLTDGILEAAGKRRLDIVAVNGTFNMIAPDRKVREKGIARFEILAEACDRLGCKVISLCTGTRNTLSMWKPHPDNSSGQAWEDMLETMRKVVRIAEQHQITLGIETEASNVVSTPKLARLLLDEMKSPYLKIIMDCANLFHENTAWPDNVRKTIKNAFDLLGNDIILAHGKDILASPKISFTAPGKGIVDFDYFLQLLEQYRFKGGMLLHGIKLEADIPGCVAFIREKIALSSYGLEKK